VVLPVRRLVFRVSEALNNTSQPARARNDLFQHIELLEDTRSFDLDARDRAAKLHYRKRDQTSSCAVRRRPPSLHPFLPPLRRLGWIFAMS
jgi:hypothetical protein